MGKGKKQGMPKVLADAFEVLADAPNGIPKLRELILDLAVRGKLVPQDPNDEPASELLKRIEKEKHRLIKEKVIRKRKSLPLIDESKLPWAIPTAWQWTYLGEIGDWGAGATPKRGELSYYGGSIPWFKSGELNDCESLSECTEQITEKAVSETSVRLNKVGDVLIAMYGATIGKLAILNVEGTTNQAVCACTCSGGINNRYLFKSLAAMRKVFIRQGAGGAQPNISRVKIVNTLFALPPLAEQKRIVEKVDALMSLCDDMEAKKEARSTVHLNLTKASLGSLTEAEDAKGFAKAWKHVSESFDTLITTPESVTSLRQSILDLAVRGKLVPQDPKDEPASELLKRIEEEKERLIAEKLIRKPKEIAEPASGLYPIPDSWNWAFFQDLTTVITDGTHQTPKYTDSGRLFVSAQCVKPFRFHPQKCRFVSEESFQNYIKNRMPEDGDILMSRVGSKIGEAVTNRSGLEFALYVSVCLIKANWSELHSEFFTVVLNGPTGRRQTSQNILGRGVSQGNLNLGLIRSFQIPLPPLGEQKRIVAKVDELMVLCDQLDANLSNSSILASKLASSVVAQVG